MGSTFQSLLSFFIGSSQPSNYDRADFISPIYKCGNEDSKKLMDEVKITLKSVNQVLGIKLFDL